MFLTDQIYYDWYVLVYIDFHIKYGVTIMLCELI